ncbi:hypothetical protein Scep_030055 [Stephania cephalantha]|uniref:Uncharacterized protein n=1 Tax=Stephania cephalantha TaxID=152367 RepID=A0AAP0DYU5_9MAGN
MTAGADDSGGPAATAVDEATLEMLGVADFKDSIVVEHPVATVAPFGMFSRAAAQSKSYYACLTELCGDHRARIEAPRALYPEFKDHVLVKTRRMHCDGQDCLYIPLTCDALEKRNRMSSRARASSELMWKKKR